MGTKVQQIIRGLTTGDITTKDWLKVWWKEFRVSLLVSIVLASFNFIRIAFFTKTPEGVNAILIATSVSGALLLTIILAKSIGGLLPILAKKLKLDPAVMAAPIITTLVDAAAIIIYFTFVTHLLFLKSVENAWAGAYDIVVIENGK